MEEQERNTNEEPVDWGSIFRRKDRPLPKPGCSWAFYIVLTLLIIYLIVKFIEYKNL